MQSTPNDAEHDDPNGGNQQRKTSDWQTALAAEFNRRQHQAAEVTCSSDVKKKTVIFPLAATPFGEEEVLAMTEVLLSGQLTLSVNVEAAEKLFAETIGVPYAVMVNSGSSANLLAVAAIANKLRTVHCQPGDEILVPAVCWSTSVHPILQHGFKPVFVDADPCTFNATLDGLESKLSPKVRAVMAVHVLGNSICMEDLVSFCKRHNLILIEDTCESLGTCIAGNQMLGSFGDFGTFSFYFSHHITTGEGGMVVCKTKDDYNLLQSLRAHGWTRQLTNRKDVEALYPDIDPRFVFVNLGYNLRPLEVQGAMLRVQLQKLARFNACRRDNFIRIANRLKQDSRFSSRMRLMEASEDTDPAWYGLAFLLHQPYAHQQRAYLEYLDLHGVENRPIVSGNFTRQPCMETFCPGQNPCAYPGAEAIHTRGFFIGLHPFPIKDETIVQLIEVMFEFEFRAKHVVLVTGADGMLGRHVRDVVVAQEQEECSWVFTSRADGDLRNLHEVRQLFNRYLPTRVLHCAAKLQSISEMTVKPVEFWLDNVSVNNNVLQVAHEMRDKVGPIKLVSVLSSVMFPANAEFPVTANKLHSGPPPAASESYAMAKRALDDLTRWFRLEYQEDFVSVLPANFYGPYGDFNPKTAPLVNALIAKAEQAKTRGNADLQVMGTGRPERQVMYAGDLARILVWALENLNQTEPLLVAGPEVTIAEIARVASKVSGFEGKLKFDIAGVDGPLKRTADTSIFNGLCPGFQMLSLEDGIQRTVQWYRKNQHQEGRS